MLGLVLSITWMGSLSLKRDPWYQENLISKENIIQWTERVMDHKTGRKITEVKKEAK